MAYKPDDFNKTLANISWSSSDSENECNQLHNLKKIRTKHNDTSVSVSWIKPDIDQSSCESSPDMSPVINSSSLEESSPILAKGSLNETSPIIGQKRAFKKAKNTFKRICKIEEVPQSCQSPDMFVSQSSQIIESVSPETLISDVGASPIPAIGTCEETNVRDLQLSSGSVNFSSQITSYKSTESSTNSLNSLYYQPPKKRKRYKKNGLAHQLQKVLNLQKSRILIWKHELFMNKLTDLKNVIEFMVIHIKKEYGNTILECEFIKKITPEGELTSAFYNIKNNLMLILIKNVENVNFVKNNVYKLYPPYEFELVCYKTIETLCYYNVTKIS